MVRLVARFGFLAFAFLACHSMVPPNGPNDACRNRCDEKASARCSHAECVRGCEMSLDRIVEHEANNVIACVARSTRGCSDTVWAECSARIGGHADGGPPPPVTETFPDED